MECALVRFPARFEARPAYARVFPLHLLRVRSAMPRWRLCVARLLRYSDSAVSAKMLQQSTLCTYFGRAPLARKICTNPWKEISRVAFASSERRECVTNSFDNVPPTNISEAQGEKTSKSQFPSQAQFRGMLRTPLVKNNLAQKRTGVSPLLLNEISTEFFFHY